MNNTLPSSSLSKIVNENANPDYSILSSDVTEPTVNQGTMDLRNLFVY